MHRGSGNRYISFQQIANHPIPFTPTSGLTLMLQITRTGTSTLHFRKTGRAIEKIGCRYSSLFQMLFDLLLLDLDLVLLKVSIMAPRPTIDTRPCGRCRSWSWLLMTGESRFSLSAASCFARPVVVISAVIIRVGTSWIWVIDRGWG